MKNVYRIVALLVRFVTKKIESISFSKKTFNSLENIKRFLIKERD